MRTIVWAAVAAGVLCGVAAFGVADEKKPAAKTGVAALDWLAGSWHGDDGEGGSWETCYTSASGGAILSASKEMREGKMVMFDYEVWGERDGKVVMSPFPFGNRSVEFTAKDFDPAKRRIQVENAKHDFPRSITYELGADGKLHITLVGDQGGGEMSVTLDLTRAK